MSATFLTFPLCVLSMPMDWKERMQRIISHSMQRAGRGDGAQEIGADKIGAEVVEKKLQDYKPGTDHDAIIRGSIILGGINPGSLPNIVRKCSEVSNYVAKFESKHGRDALVFIANELFWGCLNEGSPTYREFSTLCAVNSIIGMNGSRPVLIRRAMIIARQLGYKKPDIMAQELKKLTDGSRPLTTKELRGTLNELEERKLIVRCHASQRMVYFSTKLTADELREAVLKRREARNLVQIRREIDRSTLAGASRGPLKKEGPVEGHLKRKTAKEAEKGPLKNKGPVEGHNGATRGPRTGPLKEKPLNKSLLIKASKDLPREKEIAAEPELNGKSLFDKMRAAVDLPPSDDAPAEEPGEAPATE